MKHINKFIAGSFIGLGVLFVLAGLAGTVQGVSVLDTDTTLGGVPSTTPQYIEANSGFASTTEAIFDTLGIDHVDMNLQITASGTPAVFHWKYEFSDDLIDWFGEDLAQTNSAGQVSHSTSTLDHFWEPTSAADPNATGTRKNISINPIASRYMKVILSVTGANGEVWARFARKGETNR